MHTHLSRVAWHHADSDQLGSHWSERAFRLAPWGILIVNFNLNPRRHRGSYLQLRRSPDVTMVAVAEARSLLARHGLMVRQVRGYSYLPYRRDGSQLILPGLRRRIEERLARIDRIAGWGSCFILVAEHTETDLSRVQPGERS